MSSFQPLDAVLREEILLLGTRLGGPLGTPRCCSWLLITVLLLGRFSYARIIRATPHYTQAQILTN